MVVGSNIHHQIWMEWENLFPFLEKELRIVQILADSAKVAQVLNTITLDRKIISAPPTQEAAAIFGARAKSRVGHLASKVFISHLVILFKNVLSHNLIINLDYR